MNLETYLRQAGETQESFGSRLTPAVSGATVSRWQSGEMLPRRHRILEIEKVTAGKVRPQDWFAVSRAGDAA